MGKVTSVNCRSLFQRYRNGFHIALYQENTDRKTKGYIGKKQSEPSVVDSAFLEYYIDRNQQRMDGDQHTHQEHDIQHTVQFEMNTCQNITYNKTKYNNKNNRHACSSYTV